VSFYSSGVILAAALLVLLGLGLFVGGILTDTTVLYWLCVGACGAAGVFLVLARIRMGRAPAVPAPPARTSASTSHRQPASTAVGAPAGATTPGGPTAVGGIAGGPEAEVPAEPVVAGLAAAPTGDPAAPPAASPEDDGPAAEVPAEAPSTPAHAPRGTSGGSDAGGDPPVEEVEVTDLLVVVDLHDEVLVVDEHPRYHLGGCRWLAGRETFPLPLDEARADGFTPCAWCEPDRNLAQRERGRRAGRKA
jgi:hypothetical protein